MKKFMLLVASVALLSGCATQNPHYKNLQVFGGTVIGAAGGYKVAGVLGGVLGAVVGHEVVKGAQWNSNDDEVIYVRPYGYGYGGYTPSISQGMYLQPGMCDDARSGGQISCRFLAENPRYERWGIIESNVQPPPQVHARQASYPRNMWEKSDQKQQNAEAKKPTAIVGPTVSNYLDEPMVHKSCKTGNYGHDGKCLLNFVPALVKEQRDCESGGGKCYQYNAGKWAGIYTRLGNDLLLRQKEEQGGEFANR